MSGSHEAEYLGAVAGMVEVYGLPDTHVARLDDGRHVFWVCPKTGHLLHGLVVRTYGHQVLVKVTRATEALVDIAALVPVPRFFGGAGA